MLMSGVTQPVHRENKTDIRRKGASGSAGAILAGLFVLLTCSGSASAASAGAGLQAQPGDIIQVTLSELHPTQMAVGKLQIAGTLAGYSRHPERVFKKLCQLQGAGKVASSNAFSTLKDPTSYTCTQPAGTYPREMIPVDIGPTGQLYLTDGHHALTALWQIAGNGEMKLPVRVEQNLSRNEEGGLLSQQQFEQKMAALKHVLPVDAEGGPVRFADLPDRLAISSFQDDPYRSLLYYLRGIAYDKPQKQRDPLTGKPYPEVPFLEFYWGQMLRSKMAIKDYDLRRQQEYIRALKEAARIITTLPASTMVGSSGYTAAALGQMNQINEKKLSKLAAPDSPLAKALAWQAGH